MSEGQEYITLRQNRHMRNWIAVAAILLYFYLALNSLVSDSPTMDEQNHIARGLAFLRSGDPRLSLEHPPLVNSLSSAFLLTLPELELPFDHPSWDKREGWYEFSDLFLWQYNHDVEQIVFLARMPIVFLGLGLALAGFTFSRQLWGSGSAVLALILFLFEPNILAHSRYATTDIGGVLFSFLATFALYRVWIARGSFSWARWLIAALFMGLAFASKLSILAYVPVWIVLALLPLYPAARRSNAWHASFGRLAQLITAGIASLLVIWVLYAGEWGQTDFISTELAWLNPIDWPMPTFWEGLEQMLLLGSGGRASTFLLGQFSAEGFANYYPVAFLVKTPFVLLVMILLATILLIIHRRTRQRALFLVIAATGFATIVALGKLNIGYRHVLPALPYLLVLASGLATPELRPENGPDVIRQWSVAGIAAVLAAGMVATTAWIHPHYLSYFNWLAGGSGEGYRVLVDSNVDWGQDLVRLRRWMNENEVDSVNLGWFGSADPQYYGLDYRPLPGLGRDQFFRLWWEVPFNIHAPEPGLYAISVTNLWELPLTDDEKKVYEWFRSREPDDRIGYSILIYEVP